MPGGDRWIGDYRSMGLVEWPAGLREAMRARARRATGRFMGWTWLAVAAFVFSVAMAAVASGPSGRLWKPEFVFAGMGVLVFLVAVLRGNDWQKERIKARKALRSERLERFELGRHVEEEVAANRALGWRSGWACRVCCWWRHRPRCFSRWMARLRWPWRKWWSTKPERGRLRFRSRVRVHPPLPCRRRSARNWAV